jgi:uncharacterized protein (TIGR00290 family)
MKAFIYWSGGKDAAMAYETYKTLYGLYPTLLVSRVTNAGVIAAHEIKSDLITAQANAMDIQLQTVIIPAFAPNVVYEEIMSGVIAQLKAQGYTHAIFGDIFLEDLKSYHINFHQKLGIECLFPLWGNATKNLSHQIIAKGISAVLTAINTRYLTPNFAGRLYNEKFLSQLPDGVDACGENGEFHTFVYNAPFFKYPLVTKQIGNIETITYHAGTAYETTMAYVTMALDAG